jgi:hypothetical protein
MMRTPGRDFALLYFENRSKLPEISGFIPDTLYSLQWYHPARGEWLESVILKTDEKGILVLPFFPDRQNPALTDWAAKITVR